MYRKYIEIVHDNYKNIKRSYTTNVIAISAFFIPIICRIYFYFENAVPEIKSLDILFTLILSIALIDITIIIVFVFFYILKLIFKKDFIVSKDNINNNLFYNIIFILGYIISILSVVITFIWYTYQLIIELI